MMLRNHLKRPLSVADLRYALRRDPLAVWCTDRGRIRVPMSIWLPSIDVWVDADGRTMHGALRGTKRLTRRQRQAVRRTLWQRVEKHPFQGPSA